MPHYCCVEKCHNCSAAGKNISWHRLPINSPTLLSVWITKIKTDPRYFNVNKHTKIRSEHFVDVDEAFVNPSSTKRRLKSTALPSVFAWSKEKLETREKTSAMLKLEKNRTEHDEATDSASEGESDVTDVNLISRKTQTYENDVCGNLA